MAHAFQAAQQAMLHEGIDVISFDLFDTLVYRPLFSNRDHLRLFSSQIRAEYNIDIESARLAAALEIQNPYASLQEIWQHIALSEKIDCSMTALLIEREFTFDLEHLYASQRGMDLYTFAESTGKRIIVLSDMYYSADQIKTILVKCGYHHISAIYVSCEKQAVKRSGALYNVALHSERVNPPQRFLHIGDNMASDLFGATIASVTAIHIPGDREWFEQKWGLIRKRDIKSIYESAVYGTGLHWLADHDRSSCVADAHISVFACFVLFPMLIHAALTLHTHTDVQNAAEYKYLDFVSRDGFLMKTAYDILSAYFPDSAPSRYLHTSRIASTLLTDSSFADRLRSPLIPVHCTLERFIRVAVSSDALQKKLFNEIDEATLQLSVRQNLAVCRSALEKYDAALSSDFREQKSAAFAYYQQFAGSGSRMLLIDCGFRGTVSRQLTEGFAQRILFDKFFLWAKPDNAAADIWLGTNTYTLFSGKSGRCAAPMVETFFSALSGSCIGFRKCAHGNIVPRFDEAWYPIRMRSVVEKAQEIAIMLVKTFCADYGEMFGIIPLSTMESCFSAYARFCTSDAGQIFENVFFKEPFSSCPEDKSLYMMIREKMGRNDD